MIGGMRDEVDRLVEAWQRERADLDLQPMEVLSRVTRLGHHLDRARRQAFAEHAIESWEFDVLAALRRAGTPYELSPGRLLKETLVTSGTMTNRVDRLAARGLVERLPDPSDRRGVLVRLTADGRTTVDGALEGLLHRERDLLAGLDADQQRRARRAAAGAGRAVRGRGPVTGIWLRFLSGPDIDELALTRGEIIAAVESVVAAHGRGETVFEPRVHLVPDNGDGSVQGHFNVLRGHVAASASAASAASRWSATSCPTTGSACPASWRSPPCTTRTPASRSRSWTRP